MSINTVEDIIADLKAQERVLRKKVVRVKKKKSGASSPKVKSEMSSQMGNIQIRRELLRHLVKRYSSTNNELQETDNGK